MADPGRDAADLGIEPPPRRKSRVGLWIALGYRWGSAWYVHIMVPYLRSVFTLSPNVAVMAELPWAVRLHVLGAFTLFAVFSFTRMVHVLVAPLPYLWRRPQLVLWHRDRRHAQKARGEARVP